MGVSGLWTLLEPCGRRIDIKALRGKRLAIGTFILKSMYDIRFDKRDGGSLDGVVCGHCRCFWLDIPFHQGNARREGRNTS